MRTFERIACGLALTVCGYAGVAQGGETVTVSTAAELVTELTRLNSESYDGDKILLEDGWYDVSDYEMRPGSAHIWAKWVTLEGKSGDPAKVILYESDGSISNRVLDCYGAGAAHLTISNSLYSLGKNCVMPDGRKDGGSGAGICISLNNSANPCTFTNVVVTHCRNGAYHGGAVSGSAVWRGCTFANNSAPSGGAAQGGTFYGCFFTNNTAYNGPGGAAYYSGTFYDCRAVGNSACTFGGAFAGSNDMVTNYNVFALKVDSGTTYVYGGEFEGNYAGNNTSGGGGFARCYVRDAVIRGNSGAGAGGLYQCYASNCVIVANKATSNCGGGAYNSWLDDCVVSNNTAVMEGGGVYAVSMRGGEVSCNRVTSATGLGGGASAGYSMLVFSGTRVHGNSAYAGGGIYIRAGVAVSNVFICCNESWNNGGGARVAAGGLLADAIVSNNVVCSAIKEPYTSTSSDSASTDIKGGGVCTDGGGCVRACEIVHNRAVNWNNHSSARCYGAGVCGGIYSNCVIRGNAMPITKDGCSTRQGAGVNNAELVGCEIRDNVVVGVLGAPSGINNGKLEGCVVSNNPGIAVRSVTYVRDCVVAGRIQDPRWMINTRIVGFTNGYYLAEGANVLTNGWFDDPNTLLTGSTFATNCLIVNNRANTLLSAMRADGLTLVNCTIADNVANVMFSAANTDGNFLAAVNCLFARNQNASGAGRNAYCADGVNDLTLRNCFFADTRAADGRNVNATIKEESGSVFKANAGFVEDGTANAYALKATSRARGIGLLLNYTNEDLDFRKNPAYPRVRDGLVDAGCYQCWLNPPGTTLIVR